MSNNTSSSKYEKFNSPLVIGYRLVILLLGLGAFLYSNVTAILAGNILASDKFFTTQSNFFVVVWLFLALMWRKNPQKLESISGYVHAIVTVYISVTFIVFNTILASSYHPTGIDVYTNIIEHMLNPVIFVLDYLYTERTHFSWKAVMPMLIYPHVYLVFSFIMGSYITVGDYIYPFLDYPTLGLGGYLTWYLVLVILFLILFVIYTAFVKFMVKGTRLDSNPT